MKEKGGNIQRGETRKRREKPKNRKERSGRRRGGGGARTGIKEALEQGRVLADVNAESFGRPASGSLYDRRGDPVFSKGGSFSCPHRLAGNITVEEKPEASDEERASGDFPARSEPEGRCHWV